MGISNDGLIAYGIDLDENLPNFLEDIDGEMEMDEFIGKVVGLVRPDHEDYSGDDWKNFWAKQREAEANFPVQLVTYCSYDYPMYVLAVRGTVLRANRGCALAFHPSELAVDPRKLNQYNKFLKEHGYDPSTARWLLMTMNG